MSLKNTQIYEMKKWGDPITDSCEYYIAYADKFENLD